MYLSRLNMVNWRSYANGVLEFREPTQRKSVVLVGAMNGHGKTSILMALYLGLFGRFGLRYCEGFSKSGDDVTSYRNAIERYRRDVADSDEPTIIDITFRPALAEAGEDDVRVVRRWYFTTQNKPRQGDGFEEVDLYVGERLQKRADSGADKIAWVYDRIERLLFPAHVAPAFFFDGEQAQKLIENMGEVGIKKAVEVMFGTKVITEAKDTIGQYLVRARQNVGGRRRSSDREQDLNDKVAQRDQLNQRIGAIQADLVKVEQEKDNKERERSKLHEDLMRMGGAANTDAGRIQADYVRAEKELEDAGKAMSEVVRPLGLSLALSRLSAAIENRLRSEERRESWEGLRRGTLENKQRVLDAALPSPKNNDALLAGLNEGDWSALRIRFEGALESIYNPPPNDCAGEYLLGHVKGEARSRTLVRLRHAQAIGANQIKGAAKRTKVAAEALDELKRRKERVESLPEATKTIREQLDSLNSLNQEYSRKLGMMESELKKLKADLHVLNEEVGRLQEELSRLGPEQKRIAVAERISRALEELHDQLRPTTTARLEEFVTKNFEKIADKRFKGARIRLPVGEEPQVELPDGSRQALLNWSGFEKRSFGIAFSIALAEITRRRVPLVIDTPLGNADSEYRPRTLKALTGVDLDQIIILTHDEEVTPKLAEGIAANTLQKFLVRFEGRKTGSIVNADSYF
jgi:DNA sulfur modification protein DndD